MSFNDFMNKVRQWDNRTAQWIIRHFYILFFEMILVAIFIGVFVNAGIFDSFNRSRSRSLAGEEQMMARR